jgi:hypothetical protein
VNAPELIQEFYKQNPNAEGGGRIKGRRKARIRTIALPSAPTSSTLLYNPMQNALQLSLYPADQEDYIAILDSTFNTLAINAGGEWFTTPALTEDAPEEENALIRTASIQQEDIAPANPPEPASNTPGPTRGVPSTPVPRTGPLPSDGGVLDPQPSLSTERPLPRTPECMRSKSPQDSWRQHTWAESITSDSTDRAQWENPRPWDSLCPSEVSTSQRPGEASSSSGLAVEEQLEGPLRGRRRDRSQKRKRGKRAQPGPKFYCGNCNKDGVNHRYADCPLRRGCLHCDKKGHWTHDCWNPHIKCRPQRCRVGPYHKNYGLRCPEWATGLEHTSPWDEDDMAAAMDFGEALYDDIDWEA